MLVHSKKNLPQPTKETEKYWEGCRNHELLIQQCSNCGVHQFYPRMMCTNCSSRRMKWVRSSGRGKVVSYTSIYRAPSKAYMEETPYVLAIIQLEEGPTMMSNIVQCKPEDVLVNMIVEVVFEDWSEEISIPMFRPINRELPHLHLYLKL
jgi:uncharacterized protein